MKTTFQIEIDSGSLSTFFPKYRIKDKLKIIEIILESARYILYGNREKIARSTNKMILYRDKMSRLFFVSQEKTYSIIFPFSIDITGEKLTLHYKSIIEIDSLSISNLIILLKNPLISSDNCLDFIEPILELEDEHAVNYWPILKDLLMQEDGYIRYDLDQVGHLEAKKKKQEHKHPLHHLDFFYTNSVTFKLGLNNHILDIDLIDTLNTETNCKYLNCP